MTIKLINLKVPVESASAEELAELLRVELLKELEFFLRQHYGKPEKADNKMGLQKLIGRINYYREKWERDYEDDYEERFECASYEQICEMNTLVEILGDVDHMLPLDARNIPFHDMSPEKIQKCIDHLWAVASLKARGLLP